MKRHKTQPVYRDYKDDIVEPEEVRRLNAMVGRFVVIVYLIAIAVSVVAWVKL